jgi:carboxyl-terminal processing protease
MSALRLAAAFLAALGATAQVRPAPDTDELERELKRFMDVLRVAREEAAEEPSLDAAFYGGAIPGMLRRLDPHSIFLDKDQFEQMKEMERSVSKGFGSIVSILPGRVMILQVNQGAPAQKAGLAPGDEIVVINNIPLAGLGMEQLVEVLGVTRQRPAQLLVRRPGTARPMAFTLVPEELQSPSVDRAFALADGAGYIRITSFDGDTGKQAREAIEKLGGDKLKALALDLRDNPGGMVTAGLETAALFLKPGDRILSARGRSAQTEEVDVPAEAQPYKFRLAVLVNGKTASAAEIVAGAIQDNDRGVLVGEPTFGKGLVQRVFPLREGTGLALTTAFYYTPSGRSIQRPLSSSMELGAATAVDKRPEFKTKAGRTVYGGGGLEPDHRAYQEENTRFRVVMEGSGSFPAFAAEWVSAHKAEVRREMEVSAATLDEFKLWLSQRNIRPSISEWTAQRTYLAARLQQEILNLSLGVAAGDEVEMRRDPVVRRALELLSAP